MVSHAPQQPTMSYEQAQEHVYCASRLIDHFKAPPLNGKPIEDPFYWRNKQLLEHVVNGETYEDFRAHDLFVHAAVYAGVPFNTRSDLINRVREYGEVIHVYGQTREVPPSLVPARDEMLRVFSRVMRLGAEVCRRNPPPYHQPR